MDQRAGFKEAELQQKAEAAGQRATSAEQRLEFHKETQAAANTLGNLNFELNKTKAENQKLVDEARIGAMLATEEQKRHALLAEKAITDQSTSMYRALADARGPDGYVPKAALDAISQAHTEAWQHKNNEKQVAKEMTMTDAAVIRGAAAEKDAAKGDRYDLKELNRQKERYETRRDTLLKVLNNPEAKGEHRKSLETEFEEAKIGRNELAARIKAGPPKADTAAAPPTATPAFTIDNPNGDAAPIVVPAAKADTVATPEAPAIPAQSAHQDAYDWMNANPDDPRTARMKKAYGIEN